MSGLEIKFQSVNQRHQPGDQGHVGRVGLVRLEGGAIGEAHDAAEGVALAAWGKVVAHVGSNEAGDDALKGANLLLGLVSLLLRGDGFPAEGEGVDEGGVGCVWQGGAPIGG